MYACIEDMHTLTQANSSILTLIIGGIQARNHRGFDLMKLFTIVHDIDVCLIYTHLEFGY